MGTSSNKNLPQKKRAKKESKKRKLLFMIIKQFCKPRKIPKGLSKLQTNI